MVFRLDRGWEVMAAVMSPRTSQFIPCVCVCGVCECVFEYMPNVTDALQLHLEAIVGHLRWVPRNQTLALW